MLTETPFNLLGAGVMFFIFSVFIGFSDLNCDDVHIDVYDYCIESISNFNFIADFFMYLGFVSIGMCGILILLTYKDKPIKENSDNV